MLEGFELLGHSSIKITGDRVIYIDPYKIKDEPKDADMIFITHTHYDHFSSEDIQKVRNQNSIIIITDDGYTECLKMGFKEHQINRVEPNKRYQLHGLNFETVPAYNVKSQFHPKSSNWVGYILEIRSASYYIAGDTDMNEDNVQVECDVAFVPVGGTYTMDAVEAAKFVNEIQPRIAVPIHYGTIVGTKADAERFEGLLKSTIECRIMM